MSEIIKTLITRYPALASCRDSIEQSIEAWIDCFSSGGKLLTCGNGGSASDADHITGELLKGFGSERKLDSSWHEKLGSSLASNLQGSLPAIALPNFVSLMTAYSNDCNAEYAFAQLTLGLGNKGDVLLCISTSGTSKNVLHAADVARAKGMKVIALTGKSGGALKDKVDISIQVPETEVYKIQELHLPIYHAMCFAVERALF